MDPTPLHSAQPAGNSGVCGWDTFISARLYNSIGLRVPRSLFLLLEHSGSGVFWLPFSLLLWAFLPHISSAQRSFWLNTFVGLCIDAALASLVKAIFRRPRPVYNNHGDFVVVVSVDRYSLPSGHSSRAAFLATFVCVWLLHERPVTCGFVLAWGITVGLSRALMGRHYLGDVLAGLAFGVVTAGILTKGMFTPSACLISTAESTAARSQMLRLWRF